MDILSDGTAPGQRVRHSHSHHHEPDPEPTSHHHKIETVAHYTCLECGYEWDAADDADDADAETVADEESPVCSHCGERADMWISLLRDEVPAIPLCLSCALATSRAITEYVGDRLDALGIPSAEEPGERISAPAAARSSLPVPVPGGNRAARRAAMRRRRQHGQLRHVGKGKRP